MKIVATTSAVDRPNADRWNAARSRQKSIDIEKICVLMNVAKIRRKLMFTESHFYFANISLTKAGIFMKF